MTDVRVRNVDDWVVELHRNRAKLEGRSLENELRQVLTDAALAKKQALAAELRAAVKGCTTNTAMFSDSTIGIRAERDAR